MNDLLIFEWDEEKNRINFRKHGIYFQTAAKVFYDINHVVLRDEDHSQWEDRYQAIGKVNNVLMVVHTKRGDCIRIISARRATREERRLYYDNKSDYPQR